ncbi:MAG TPA: phytanoyl-CoA dioxygenase family protein, partial [Abditibacteriaceae bacterium]
MSNPASIIPRRMVDEITPSLQEEVNFFLKWGYLIVDNAITEEQLGDVTSAFDDCLGNQDREFTHSLLEEDERFDCLLENQPVIQRMKAILGNCLQLHSATARLTRPGTPDQPWHRDGNWPVSPEGTPYGSIPGQINCAYYLDELTAENGPLVILPGSQRVPFGPPAGHVGFPDQKLVFAKPGQAVIFDGWLFHRGGA